MPLSLRRDVLRYAHDVKTAAQLGIRKTLRCDQGSTAQQLKLRGSSSRYRVEQVLNCGCAEQWLKLIRTYVLDLNIFVIILS